MILSQSRDRPGSSSRVGFDDAAGDMSDPVPAVTEAAATGEIADIFGDIRQVYRVGVVNLIWRHLATLPGALPWVWQSVRPLYVDGTIEREAAALRASIAVPELPAFPASALVAAGLSGHDLDQIRAILAAYDRTNAMALIALSAVGCKIAGVSGDAAIASGERIAVRAGSRAWLAAAAEPVGAVARNRRTRPDHEPHRGKT
jgi:hypothetical protein